MAAHLPCVLKLVFELCWETTIAPVGTVTKLWVDGVEDLLQHEGSEGKLGQNCHQIHWGQCPLRRIWKTTQREQVFQRWGWFHGCEHRYQPHGLQRDKKQCWPAGGVAREALFLVKSDWESAALKTILASLGLDSERILCNHWRLSSNYLPVNCSSSVNC